MPRRVLFLDFDGVLNSTQHFIRTRRAESLEHIQHFASLHELESRYASGEFCPVAVSNLLHVLEESPETDIVVSSSWRCGRSVAELRDLLAALGVPAERVIDKTPEKLHRSRGHECGLWLDEHPEVTTFAIVDDDTDFTERTRPRLVRTDPHHGLLYTDARKLLLLLNGTCVNCVGGGVYEGRLCETCRGRGYRCT